MGEDELVDEHSPLDEPEFGKFGLELSPIAIYLIGHDASLHYVNRAACDMTGYDREELLMMSLPDLDPWYNMDEWPHHYREVIEKGSLILETRHRKKDGSQLSLVVHSHHTRIAGTDYVCGFAMDVTQDQFNVERRHEAEELFDIMFTSSADQVLLADDRGIIINANPVVCSNLGYEASELVGKPLEDLMFEDSKSYYREMFPKVLKEDGVTCYIKFKKSDGGELAVTCKPHVVTDQNDEIRSVLIIQNVND